MSFTSFNRKVFLKALMAILKEAKKRAMKAFRQNILQIHGKRGKEWLSSLPHRVERLQEAWGLSELKPFSHLSYNYVLSGFQGKTPIVLKLSPDADSIHREERALAVFKGFGGVHVLRREEGALLLEQLIPGKALKNSQPKESRIEIACKVIQRLHQAPLLTKENFPTIEEWFATLDQGWNLPKEPLERARRWKKELFEKLSGPKVLLHGDLHQENILSQGNDWGVIDPKGVVGYPIQEVWACVEDPVSDLRFLSQFFGYSLQELIRWYYLHLLLAACWQVEDGQDANRFLNLAQSVLSL